MSELGGQLQAGAFTRSFGEQYNLDADELTAYDFMRFRTQHRYRNFVVEGMSNQSYTLSQYNAAFPIESMILLDQNTVCAIYKLALEDGEQTIAYVVFKREVFETNGERYERWSKNGELYFISEQLGYADYQNIEVGDSMASAIEIDSDISFDLWFYSLSSTTINTNVTAYRVLTDGILILEFEGERPSIVDPSSYTVTQKTFYPYSGKKAPEYVSLTLKQLSALINH